jgi:hypothetical protein
MGELAIEIDPKVEPHTCSHCGAESTQFKGYVYDGGDAYSIYHAALYPSHADRRFALDVAIGDWDEQAEPGSRARVALLVSPRETDVVLSVHDREGWNWADSEIFGAVLSREDALALPNIADFYRVAEFVIDNDPRIAAYVKD